MPELPEVETTRRGIAPYLKDHIIRRVKIHNTSLRWPVPDEIKAISGKKILEVGRRGKYLLVKNSAGTALIHLGMSGSLRICGSGDARRKHDHAEFYIDNNRVLRFHDPRRFGCILWESGDVESHPLLANLGPEPLHEEFTADYLHKATRGRKVAVKNLIMNSQVVVGVGNIYASESLFLAGIRPGRAAQRLTRLECEKLVVTIREVLQKAINEGGTTLRDFVNTDGNPGYFAQSLHVYGRKGQACTRCQTEIRLKVIGQRASYYCPQCQS